MYYQTKLLVFKQNSAQFTVLEKFSELFHFINYTFREQVPDLIPKGIIRKRTADQWADRINKKLTTIDRGMSAALARSKFLG